MATEKTTSSLSDGDNCVCEAVPQARPLMPADLYEAAVHGNSDILGRYLGLPANEHKVMVETCDPDTQEIHKNKEVVQHKLKSSASATAFGDTVLHILAANMHNDLALRVFQKDEFLLKERNKKLETPLHLAAKVGNVDIIRSFIEQLPYTVMKDALEETNTDGDTTLHLAVKQCHGNVGELLLKFNKELVYKVNKKELSPLHLAILENQNSMIRLILEFDSSLASIQFSNGMFPVHLAASMDQKKAILILLEKYPNYANFKDQHGRNFFHIAADENRKNVFSSEITNERAWMLVEKDYDRNTPLHIAARKGHQDIMEIIFDIIRASLPSYVLETNKEGLTPFGCSVVQLLETDEAYFVYKIEEYLEKHGEEFTTKWFDIMIRKEPYSDREEVWQQVQVIGLGSVLITTISFAAAFTFPGGYDGNTGAPFLGRRFMFRAFILANALAFIRSFLCVITLVTDPKKDPNDLGFEKHMFLSSVTSMMVAFGTGSYVMLAPVNMPIALIILVLALLLGQPLVLQTYTLTNLFRSHFEVLCDPGSTCASRAANTVFKFWGSPEIQVFPLVFAFCLAFLK